MYTLSELYEWDVRAEIEPGRWVPARPLDGPAIYRIRDAWAVLRGRADAFTWPQQSSAASPEAPRE
jgi:hypothetical protein